MKLSNLFFLFAAVAASCLAQTAQTPSKPNTATAEQPSQPQADAAMAKLLTERALAFGLNSSDCPVMLTSAGLRPYMMLLSSSGSPSVPESGGVDLEFRNSSGRAIRSIDFDAEIFARRSKYDLKTVKIDLHLSASGTENLDKAFDHLRHLAWPERTNPFVLNSVYLEQVTFTDGSVWTPKRDERCGIAPNPVMMVAR